MTTFVSGRGKVFKRGPPRCHILRKRSHARLKAVTSCLDIRAWSHCTRDQREHFLELFKNAKTGFGNYIPVKELVESLNNVRNKKLIERSMFKLSEINEILGDDACIDDVKLLKSICCDLDEDNAEEVSNLRALVADMHRQRMQFVQLLDQYKHFGDMSKAQCEASDKKVCDLLYQQKYLEERLECFEGLEDAVDELSGKYKGCLIKLHLQKQESAAEIRKLSNEIDCLNNKCKVLEGSNFGLKKELENCWAKNEELVKELGLLKCVSADQEDEISKLLDYTESMTCSAERRQEELRCALIEIQQLLTDTIEELDDTNTLVDELEAVRDLMSKNLEALTENKEYFKKAVETQKCELDRLKSVQSFDQMVKTLSNPLVRCDFFEDLVSNAKEGLLQIIKDYQCCMKENECLKNLIEELRNPPPPPEPESIILSEPEKEELEEELSEESEEADTHIKSAFEDSGVSAGPSAGPSAISTAKAQQAKAKSDAGALAEKEPETDTVPSKGPAEEGEELPDVSSKDVQVDKHISKTIFPHKASNTEMDQLAEENVVMKYELNKANEQLAMMYDRAEKLTTQNSILTEKLTTCSGMLKTAEKTVKAQERTIAELSKRLKANEQRVSDLTKQNFALKDTVERLEEEVTAMRAKLFEVAECCTTVACKKSELECELNKLAAKLVACENELWLCQNELRNVKESLDECEEGGGGKAQQAEMEKAKKEARKMARQLKHLQKKYCDEAERARECAIELGQCYADRKDIEDQYMAVSKHLKAQMEENKVLKAALENALKKHKACEDELLDAIETIAHLNKQVSILDDVVAKRTFENAGTQVSDAELQKFKMKLDMCTIELDRCKTIRYECEKRLTVAEDKAAHLNLQVLRLNDVIAEKTAMFEDVVKCEIVSEEISASLLDAAQELQCDKYKKDCIIEELTQKVESLSEEIITKTETISSLRYQLGKCNTTVDLLKAALEKMKPEKLTVQTDIIKDLNDRNKKMAEELNMTLCKNDALCCSLRESQDTVDELKRSMEELKLEVAGLIRYKEGLELNITALEEELARRKEYLSNVKEELKLCKLEKQDFKNDRANFNADKLTLEKEIERLNALMLEMQEQIEKLNDEILELTAITAYENRQMPGLIKQIAELQELLRLCEDDVETERQRYARLLLEKEALEEKLGTCQDTIDDLNYQLRNTDATVALAEVKRLQRVLEEKEEMLAECKESLKSALKQIEDLLEENEKLRNELEECKINLQEQSDLRVKAECELLEVKTKLMEAMELISGLEAQVESLYLTIRLYKKDLDQCSADLAKCQGQLSDCVSDLAAANSTIQSLNSDIARLKSENDFFNNQFIEKSKELAECKTNFSDLQDAFNSCTAESERQKEELLALTNEKEMNLKMLSKLRSQVENLEEQVTNLTNENAALTEERDTLATGLANRNKELQQALGSLEKCSRQLTKNQNDLRTCMRLNEVLKQGALDCERLKELMSECEAARDQMLAEADGNQDLLTECENMKNELLSRLAKADADYLVAQERIIELEQDLSDLEKKYNYLQRQLSKNLREGAKILVTEHGTPEEVLQKLIDCLEEANNLRNLVARHEDTIKCNKEQIGYLESDLEQCKSELCEMTDGLQACEEELVKCCNERETFSSKATQLCGIVEDLRAKLSDCENEMVPLTNKVQRLEECLEEANAELENCRVELKNSIAELESIKEAASFQSSGMTDTVSYMKSLLSASRQSVHTLESRITQASEVYADLEEGFESLARSHQEVSVDLEEALSELSREKDLTSRCASKMSDISVACSELFNANKGLQRDANEMLTEIDNLHEEIETLAGQLEECEEAKRKLAQQLTLLGHQPGAVGMDESSVLVETDDKLKMQETVEKQAAELTYVKEMNKLMRDQLVDLKKIKANLVDQVNGIDAVATSAKCIQEELTRELETLKLEHEELTKKYDAEHNELAAKEKEVQFLNDQMECLNTTIKQITAEKRKLSDEVCDKDCKITELQKKVEELLAKEPPLTGLNEILWRVIEHGWGSLSFNELAELHQELTVATEECVKMDKAEPAPEAPVVAILPEEPPMPEEKKQILEKVCLLQTEVTKRQMEAQKRTCALTQTIEQYQQDLCMLKQWAIELQNRFDSQPCSSRSSNDEILLRQAAYNESRLYHFIQTACQEKEKSEALEDNLNKTLRGIAEVKQAVLTDMLPQKEEEVVTKCLKKKVKEMSENEEQLMCQLKHEKYRADCLAYQMYNLQNLYMSVTGQCQGGHQRQAQTQQTRPPPPVPVKSLPSEPEAPPVPPVPARHSPSVPETKPEPSAPKYNFQEPQSQLQQLGKPPSPPKVEPVVAESYSSTPQSLVPTGSESKSQTTSGEMSSLQNGASSGSQSTSSPCKFKPSSTKPLKPCDPCGPSLKPQQPMNRGTVQIGSTVPESYHILISKVKEMEGEHPEPFSCRTCTDKGSLLSQRLSSDSPAQPPTSLSAQPKGFPVPKSEAISSDRISETKVDMPSNSVESTSGPFIQPPQRCQSILKKIMDSGSCKGKKKVSIGGTEEFQRTWPCPGLSVSPDRCQQLKEMEEQKAAEEKSRKSASQKSFKSQDSSRSRDFSK